MNKILILYISLAIFIPLIAFSPLIFHLSNKPKTEPLYHLNDKVIVTKGFFKGSTGTLIDFYPPSNVGVPKYSVLVEQRTGEDFKTKDRGIVSIITVQEDQIKLKPLPE